MTCAVDCPCDGCGDSICEPGDGETALICPQDCDPNCGNGICDTLLGEHALTCPSDCPLSCGNQFCDGAEEDCHLCPFDCGDCCGNAQCEGQWGEDCLECPEDCGNCCGNGQCDDIVYGETRQSCPVDCATDCSLKGVACFYCGSQLPCLAIFDSGAQGSHSYGEEPACAEPSGWEGPDEKYKWCETSQSRSVEVYVTGTQGGGLLGVFVFDWETNDLVACGVAEQSTPDGPVVATAEFTSDANTPYAIVVEVADGESGTYVVDVTCSDPP